MIVGFETHFADNAMCIVSIRNVIVSLCYGEITLQHIEALNLAIPNVIKTTDQKKSAALTVIDAEGVHVGPEVRKAIVEVNHRWRDSSLCSATVLDGRGFAASAIRTIMVTMNLASRIRLPSKVFSDIAPACQWVTGFAQLPIETHDASVRISQEFNRRKVRLPQAGHSA